MGNKSFSEDDYKKRGDSVVVLPYGEHFPMYSSGGGTFPPVPMEVMDNQRSVSE